jgi:tellurite resistance protein
MRHLQLIGAGQPWRPPARPDTRSSRNRHRLAWPREVPLNSFAIPIGVAALGGVWSSVTAALTITAFPAQALFAVAALLWLAFTVAYAAGIIRRRAFVRDLHHPARGPYAAYIPVIAMLLVAHYAPVMHAAARWAMLALVAALAAVAALLIGHWITSDIAFDAVHPGYLLPVVAGPFIASIGMTEVRYPHLAVALFGVGIFFWLTIGSIVLARLITGSAVPSDGVPRHAILMSPPAAGSLAWFAISHGRVNSVQDVITGVLVVVFLVQLVLIPKYAKAPFSLSFWAFTFPLCASSNFAIRVMSAYRPGGCAGVVVVLLVITSAAVLAITVKTLHRPIATQVRPHSHVGRHSR